MEEVRVTCRCHGRKNGDYPIYIRKDERLKASALPSSLPHQARDSRAQMAKPEHG